MQKYFLTILICLSTLVINSCNNVDGFYWSSPSEYDRNSAQSYYNSFGTSKAYISKDKAKSLFGCNYRWTDVVYVYSTLFGKKYILVRHGEVITYADDQD